MYKYTTDGRKVVIVGNLNSQEIIVQEIFVTNKGDEIPSGENFIVKALHDVPVESYREREIKRIEKQYESTKKRLEDETERLTSFYKKQHFLLEEKTAILKQIIPALSVEVFQTVTDFLANHFKYFVILSYRVPTILTLEEFEEIHLQRDSYRGYEGLKLLTLYGKPEQGLQWRLNEYRDGSGSERQIIPFYTYDDAKAYVKDVIEDFEYSNELIKFLNKHEIELDEEKLKIYKQKRTESIEKDIKDHEDHINKLKEKMNEIN